MNIAIGFAVGAVIFAVIATCIVIATYADEIGTKILCKVRDIMSAPYDIYFIDTASFDEKSYRYLAVWAFSKNEAYKIFRQRYSSRYKLTEIRRQ